jgi:crossover junction endodeoxyribonuclease RuvC
MILGIDPGINIVGFAFVEGSLAHPVIIEYGVITTTKRGDGQQHLRIAEIIDDLDVLISKYRPSRAIVEDIFFFKNAKTVIDVAQSRGAIVTHLARNDIKVQNITPLQVKSSICNYGRADKKQIIEMVKKLYKIDAIKGPDDAADALAIAMCGLMDVKFKV